MKTLIFALLSILFFSFFATGAELSLSKRTQFKHIDALIELIGKARDAGMSDQEIKRLKLNLKGQDIDVLDYIKAFQDKKKAEHQKVKAFLAKRFLTVSDIFNEMVDMEPMRLEQLREELISGY